MALPLASALPCSLGWAMKGVEGCRLPRPPPHLRCCDYRRRALGTALGRSFSSSLSAWLFRNSLGLAFIYKGWRSRAESTN